MTASDREKWDAKYRLKRSPSPASDWLVENLRELPRGGKGLDLACGDGANALFMASRGNRMTAVDISPVGLQIGKKSGGPASVTWIEADLDDWNCEESDFDFVMCLKFLDRRRLPILVESALKPGGLFLAETYRQIPESKSHVSNPEHLLQPNEWLTMFPTFEVLAKRDAGDMSGVLLRKSG